MAENRLNEKYLGWYPNIKMLNLVFSQADVMPHCRATKKPSTFVLTTDDKKPTLRKIKRAAMQPHNPTHIAAHLILPNRTTTLQTLRTKTRKGKVHFSDFIILRQLK